MGGSSSQISRELWPLCAQSTCLLISSVPLVRRDGGRQRGLDLRGGQRRLLLRHPHEALPPKTRVLQSGSTKVPIQHDAYLNSLIPTALPASAQSNLKMHSIYKRILKEGSPYTSSQRRTVRASPPSRQQSVSPAQALEKSRIHFTVVQGISKRLFPGCNNVFSCLQKVNKTQLFPLISHNLGRAF